MGAGQYHRIDFVAASLQDQPPGSFRHGVDVNFLAAQFGFRQGDKIVGTVTQQFLAAGEFAFEIVDIFLAYRRLGTEQAEHARLRHGGSWLDRGNGAHDRSFQHVANHAERDRAGRVAGDTD